MRFIVPFLCLLAWPAQAQECRGWLEMVEYLGSYGQIQNTRALTKRSDMMAIFVNQDQDTWTVVRQNPLGCAIVWAQGIGWKWLYSGSKRAR